MSGFCLRKAVARSLVHGFYLARGQSLARELRRYSRSQWMRPLDRMEEQLRRLRIVLEDAHRRLPFYREKLDVAGVRPDRIRSADDLMRVPITTREQLRRHFGSNSIPLWRRAWSLSPRHTSGSSGDPLVLFKDFRTLAVMDAVMYRNYGWFGIRPGDLQLRFWGTHFGWRRFASASKDLLLNRRRFSSFNVSSRTARRFLEQVERSPGAHVYGYAQTVYSVAEIIAALNREVPPGTLRGTILTGEMIAPAQREVIERVFNCRTINEYGCTEAGVIAFECPRGRMHVMENLLVEVDPSGGGANVGEVLLTELEAVSFPLIRYQLGDLASVSEEACSCGSGLAVLSGLRGRSNEMIECQDGRRIDPYFFWYLISSLPRRVGVVHQFQIVEEDPGSLRFLIVTSDDFTREGIAMLREKAREVLGEDIRVEFEQVSEIPTDSSGKLRCFSRRLRSGQEEEHEPSRAR